MFSKATVLSNGALEQVLVWLLEEDPFSPFVERYGYDYRCVAELRVWNLRDTPGKWTIRYKFNIAGKEVVTDSITKSVPELNPITYIFYSEECQEGDPLTGEYEVVASPTAEDCEYKTVYPQVSVTETRKRPVEKERLFDEYEPLWQKLLGYNRHKKV